MFSFLWSSSTVIFLNIDIIRLPGSWLVEEPSPLLCLTEINLETICAKMKVVFAGGTYQRQILRSYWTTWCPHHYWCEAQVSVFWTHCCGFVFMLMDLRTFSVIKSVHLPCQIFIFFIFKRVSQFLLKSETNGFRHFSEKHEVVETVRIVEQSGRRSWISFSTLRVNSNVT